MTDYSTISVVGGAPEPTAGYYELREPVIFPYGLTPITVEGEENMKSLQRAMSGNRLLAIFPELPPEEELHSLPHPVTIPSFEFGGRRHSGIGVLARVVKRLELPDGSVRIVLRGTKRINFSSLSVSAADGAVVQYRNITENRDENQRRIYEKFLDDMEPGASVVTGWYTEERSGITTATSRGLSTVPSDLFSNMTVFSREKEILKRKPAPSREPENKVYAALFISDGDNIQYCQRYLRKLWDASVADRGSVALNWTISPALTEAAPDIMNYYYSTATQKDCFVSGPSGFGYAMPVNTLAEEIPAGNYVKDDSAFAEYAAMSGYYCGLAGLPAVTVWDNMTAEQRHLYAVNAPELLGITVQLFTDNEEKISSTETGGMPVKQLTPCYCTEISHRMLCIPK